METTINKKNRKRRTSGQIQEFIEQWRESGKSKKVFCKENGLSHYTFESWVNPKPKLSKKKSNDSEFVPVSIKQTETTCAFAEINFSNGQHLIIYSPVGAPFLKSLLR